MDRTAVVAALIAALDPKDRRWILKRLRSEDRVRVLAAMPPDSASRRQGEPMHRLRRLLGETSPKNVPTTNEAWERSATVTMFLAEAPDAVRSILRSLVEADGGRHDPSLTAGIRPAARESMIRHMRQMTHTPSASVGGG